MPVKRSHIIQRQTFELSASGNGINLNWEQRASDCVRDILNPCIEECFNEVSLASHHLIIDKLDIDLGSFTGDEFERTVAQRLRELLNLHLQVCIKTPFEDTQERLKINEENSPAKLISHSQAIQLALQHFLTGGKLPWWYSVESNSILVDELFETAWMSEITETHELRHTLQNSEYARIRLANHFTIEWIAEFLETIGLRGKDALIQWQLIERISISFPGLKALLQQHFWTQWIITSIGKKEFTDIALIITKTTKGNTQLTIQIAQVIKNICKEQHFPDTFITHVEHEIEKIITGTPENKLTQQQALLPQHSSHKIDSNKQTIEQILDEISSPKKIKTKTSEELEEEGLIIAAAGLVILHPFLQELFSSNGLLEKNKWASDAASHRAVKYLSYLSYSNENAPEYDLVFHKTLAGIDVETALEADLPLTETEIASCNELLDAVITHWKALRNTSADGLREAFLQREGKISLAEKGYIIHVAHKPQDILLSHLPWGCGMIKLPWLDKIIHVTWI